MLIKSTAILIEYRSSLTTNINNKNRVLYLIVMFKMFGGLIGVRGVIHV